MPIIKPALVGFLTLSGYPVIAHDNHDESHPCTSCTGPEGSYYIKSEAGYELQFTFGGSNVWFEYFIEYKFEPNDDESKSELMYVSSERMQYEYDAASTSITMVVPNSVADILANISTHLVAKHVDLWTLKQKAGLTDTEIQAIFTSRIADISFEKSLDQVMMNFLVAEPASLRHVASPINLKEMYLSMITENNHAFPRIVDQYVPAPKSDSIPNILDQSSGNGPTGVPIVTSTKNSYMAWNFASVVATGIIMISA